MDVASLLVYAAPVALAAIGETVVEKAGVINIGIEGSMLAGAFFGMLGSFLTHSPWIGLATGISAGAILALLGGWFTVNLGADQVVVGTAVNLFALGLTGTLYRARFGESEQLLTVVRVPNYHGIDAVIVAMILSVPVVWFLLNRTGWGLAVRAVGEYPAAAEAAGYSVARLKLGALLVGGVFAGLAGAYLSVGIAGSFAENMSAGRGFVAIAMVTFGRWKPQVVFLAALLIGYAESLQFALQASGRHIPYQLLLAMPYALALLVLAVVGKGASAPAWLARPYNKVK